MVKSNSYIKFIYLAIITIIGFIFVDLYYITTQPGFRILGYPILQISLTLGLVLVGFVLYLFNSSSYERRDGLKKIRYGYFFIFGLLIFETLVMFNFASYDIERITYYSNLGAVSGFVILTAALGNILRVEKDQDSGFHISIYDKSSPLSPRSLILSWFGIFFLMAMFVGTSGAVLLQYPTFAVGEGLAKPLVSGFAVGDFENIVLLIFPFAVGYGLLRKKLGEWGATGVGIVLGVAASTWFHGFVYQTNTVALIVVAVFFTIFILTYKWSKSIVLASALHIGNNFWGAYFSANVIGLSAGFSGAVGSLTNSVLIIVAAAVSIYLITRFSNKKRAKRI